MAEKRPGARGGSASRNHPRLWRNDDPSHELLTASTPAFFVPARLPPNLLPHLDRAPPLPSPRSRRTARREWPRCAMSRRHGP